MKRHSHRALPEAVDPAGSWTVQDGDGVAVRKTRTGDNVLTAPVKLTPTDRRLRAEALARAKFSPQRWKGIPDGVPLELVDAMEGVRTRALAWEAGVARATLNAPTMTLPPGSLEDMVKHATPLQLGVMYATAHGNADVEVATAILDAAGSAMAGLIRTVANRAAREAIKRHGRSRPAANAIRAAEVLWEALGDIDPDDPDQVEAAETAESLEDLLEQWNPEGDGTGECRWGNMKIEVPGRPLVMPPKMRGGRTRRPSRRGTVPVRPWREDSDGCEYRRVTPGVSGGAVLVDCSGSMSWSQDSMLAVLAAMPAATIAGYSGDGTDGVLRIFARDGKRVEDYMIHSLFSEYGGNDVDLPALVWLSQQAGPRFWISDGYVVPGGGGDHKTALRQCAYICRRESIRRLDSEEALVVRLTRSGDVVGEQETRTVRGVEI